ncbi:hypothetical protein [Klebsiella sp. PL-2018]|uniref:hypothetical protein n=1 Tax=Klebsiella TaxID=570 RepID=UPI001C23787F|nr:hypothetical protein [Klebsiella sp. PL-2018]QXD00978.1 hypothetical protein MKleb_5477 [Klebsiella sp. PL-2018]
MKNNEHARPRGRFSSLFPCRESALLTALMLTCTSTMLFVQFPENRELLLANAGGYVIARLAVWPCDVICNALSMVFSGLWFVLMMALPLIFSAVGG